MYLRVDDSTANQIDVHCDGYYVRIYTNNTHTNWIEIFDPSDTNIVDTSCRVDDVSNIYYFGYADKTATILENTPSRVVIKVVGNFDRTYGGGNELTNSDSATFIFYFYSDKIIVHFQWVISSTGVTLSSDVTDNMIIYSDFISLTSEANLYESLGSETTGTYDEENTAVYVGAQSSEIKSSLTTIHSNMAGAGTATLCQQVWGNGQFGIGWHDGTILAGTHDMVIAWIIDSADRENDGGTFLDWDTDIDTNSVTVGTICEQSSNSLRYFCHTAHTASDGAVESIVPTSRTSSQTMTYSSGTAGYDLLDEGYASKDGFTSYVRNSYGSSDEIEQYGMANVSAMGAGDITSQIIVKVYAIESGGSGTLTDGVGIRLYIDSGWETPDGGQFQDLPESWTDLTFTFTGTWTQANINAMDVELTLGSDSGDYNPTCSTIEADIYYGSNEPPNASYWHEYRMTLGNQYKDLVMAAPTTGSEVTDLVIPLDLSSDGFAADGARHSEMASEELAYTADIARLGHVDVIHDPMITTNGSTDLVVGHWKCDDNAATTALIDETGNSSCTLAGGDNTEDKDNADAVQGTSLLLNGTDDYLDLSNAIAQITDVDLFTIIIRFKPNFAFDAGTDEALLTIESAWNNRKDIYYDDSLAQFYYDENTVPERVLNTPFTSDNEFQQWHIFTIAFNVTDNMAYFFLDEQKTVYGSVATWTTDPTILRIGMSGSSYGPYYIDNVKLIDGCLLPYGAYFTGNGAVDTDLAHEDITFYWDGSDCTSSNIDIGGVQGTLDSGNTGGTTSFPTTGGPFGIGYFDNESNSNDYGISFSVTEGTHFEREKGSLSFWLNVQTWADNDRVFRLTYDGSNYIECTLYSGDTLLFNHRIAANNNYSYDTSPITVMVTGTWYYIEHHWDDTIGQWYAVNGVRETGADDTGAFTGTWGGNPTTLYIGNRSNYNCIDALISNFYITNNPNTPQIPVILGSGPIYAPIREVT